MGLSTSKIIHRTGLTKKQINKYKKIFDEIRSINGKKCKLTSANLYLSFCVDEDIGYALFRALDLDGDGIIEFEEFLVAIYLIGPAPLDDKIQFCFNQYDINGKGYISRFDYNEALESTLLGSGRDQLAITSIVSPSSNYSTSTTDLGSTPQIQTPIFQDVQKIEVTTSANEQIIQSFISSGLKYSHREPTVGETQEHITDEFFKRADGDKDGCVNFDEFRGYAQRHPEILMSVIVMFEAMEAVLGRSVLYLNKKEKENGKHTSAYRAHSDSVYHQTVGWEMRNESQEIFL
eukprot:TRINITY_DN16376_c0_g1_i1.p1 TRINITY_DN16376_c0_g1~~TRINITY_DN16376_c0_g1_i1.p1  ORF type:complete len:291 (+),score=34.91 TRINITY_DN16376_c0_g1_i1:41-913(+)